MRTTKDGMRSINYFCRFCLALMLNKISSFQVFLSLHAKLAAMRSLQKRLAHFLQRHQFVFFSH
jgi:hypothetical protein